MGPGFGAGELQKQVVPPPVQVNDDSAERRNISGLGGTSVVPPAVQLVRAPRSVPGGGIGKRHGDAVVPPPPSVSGGGSLTGQGRGNRGAGWADRWTLVWLQRLQAAIAVAARRVWWFPASPVRRLACPAAVEAARWRCLPREPTRPAWVDRAEAPASAGAMDRAADSPAPARAPARKAPAQDQTPWRVVESRPIPGPAARAQEPAALRPCLESRSRVAAATW